MVETTICNVKMATVNYVLLLTIFLSALKDVALLGEADGRIFNSNNLVDVGEYPFLVSVTLNDAHICGGFIYNHRFIVTAASCVYQKTPSQIQVTVGQNSLTLPDPGELRLQIRAITVHENYNSTIMFNDIAMLETSQEIEFNSYVNFTYYSTVKTTPFTIMGWGAIDNSGLMSTKLRKAIVFQPANCDAFPIDMYDPNTMFCWGNPEFDSPSGSRPCTYDEGSPIYHETSATSGYVVGIVSKNLACDDSDIYEAIYTRLSAYYAWLSRIGGLQP